MSPRSLVTWIRLDVAQGYELAQPGSYDVFTPVPEPGTELQLMMALGVVSLAVAGRRRRYPRGETGP